MLVLPSPVLAGGSQVQVANSFTIGVVGWSKATEKGDSMATAMAKSGAARKRGRIALVVVIVVLALLFVGSYFADRAIMNDMFERVPDDPYSTLLVYDDIAEDYDRVPLELQVDGYDVQAYIYGPENNDKGLVVFAHGIWSQHQDYLALIMYLVDNGWKVLAYDNIGCGESEGDSTLSFAQSAVTLNAVLDYVEADAQQPDSPFAGLPVVLFGHSWGGYAVTAVLNWDHDVKAVVSLSGFTSPFEVMVDGTVAAMGPIGHTQVPTLWLNSRQFCGENASLSAVDGINRAGIPVMVVHGTGDEVIGYDTSAIIAHRSEITNPNVEYVIVDAEGRNGHASYFYTIESQAYGDSLAEQREALEAEYDGNAPDSALQELAATYDKRAANEADPGLMSQVDDFFTRAIAG